MHLRRAVILRRRRLGKLSTTFATLKSYAVTIAARTSNAHTLFYHVNHFFNNNVVLNGPVVRLAVVDLSIA